MILRVLNDGLTDRGGSLSRVHFVEGIAILHGVVIIISVSRTTWSGAGIWITSMMSNIVSWRCNGIQSIILVPARITVDILLTSFLGLRIWVIILRGTHSYSRPFPDCLLVLHTLELVNLRELSHLADLTKESRSVGCIWILVSSVRFHTLLSTRVHRSIHEIGSVDVSLFRMWPTLLLHRRELLLDRRLVTIDRIYTALIHVHLLLKTSLGWESVSIEALNRTLVMIVAGDRASSWNTLSRMTVGNQILLVNFGLRYLGVVHVWWSIGVTSGVERPVNDLVDVWLLLLERLLVGHISCAYLILNDIADDLSVACHIFTNFICSLHASHNIISGR